MAKQSHSTTEPYLRILGQAQSGAAARPAQPGAPSSRANETDINEEIIREQKLRNDATEQDIKLKRQTLDRLMAFLVVETVLIFIFALFQATHWFGFRMEEWSFNLLVAATISQITLMLNIAVKNLFPHPPEKK